MPGFLYRIRQKFLTDKRIEKYFLYVVIEVLIVIIGILIAIRVDAWTESRKLREEERVVAREIYMELEENRAYLEQALGEWKHRLAHIVALKDTLVTENLQLSQQAFDSLLLGSLRYNNFSPFRKKLDHSLAAETFGFGESRDLVGAIMDLAGLYDGLEVYFQYNSDTWKEIVQPYLVTHYSFRNINNALSGAREGSRFPEIDHQPLLADPVFDNIVNNMEGDVRPFIRRLEISLHKIGEVQALLEFFYPGIGAS